MRLSPREASSTIENGTHYQEAPEVFDLLVAEERQDEKRAVERDTGLYISDLVYDANPRPLVL